MSKIVEIRCPNRPRADSDYECRRMLGGPDVDSLTAHDFSSKAFVVYHFCPDCGVFVRFEVKNLKAIPKFEVVKDQLQVIRPDDMFGLVDVVGRHAK